jgi:O-antigen ligase/polysaccharide polymerase Wzy-like membrane protein
MTSIGGLQEIPDLARRNTGTVPLLTTYLIMLVFIPSALVLAPLGGAGSPARIFSAGLLGWYLVMWLHPGFPLDRGRQPVRTAALMLTCAVVATYVSANRQVLPGLERNGIDRGLIALAGWLGVLLLAVDGIRRWDELVTLLRRMVNCATVLAAVGITQFATGLNLAAYVSLPGFVTKIPFVDLMSRGGLYRPSATTAQPLEFAAVLVICLPIALHLARAATPGARLGRWAQVALITAALPLTVSRSAVLGLAVVVLMLVPTWPRAQRRAALLVIGTALCLLWAALPGVLTVLGELFIHVSAGTSSVSRLSAYSSAGPFIAQHPWLGRGMGTFFPQTYFFVDNQYLTTLIETGVTGLAALAGLLGTGLYAARAARRAASSDRARDLLQSLAASVAAAAASFATFDALSFASASGLTFLVLGCAGAGWRLARAGSRAPAEPAHAGVASHPGNP